MTPGPARSRPHGEDGTVLVLIVGLAGVLFLLVGVVVDVSAAVLARRGVAAAADGAAVSAVQALDQGALYAAGSARTLPLSPAEVTARVGDYQRQAQADLPGLRLSGRLAGPGVVVVTAHRSVALPLTRLLGVAPLQVDAQARAQAPLRP